MNVDAKLHRLINNTVRIRLFQDVAHCGNGVPAQDADSYFVDIDSAFVRDPTATFIVRANGVSMTGVGIEPGDWLIVDCSESARNRDIVLVRLDGEMLIKRYVVRRGITYLASENSHYSEIEVAADDDFDIIGVVVHGMRNYCSRLNRFR